MKSTFFALMAAILFSGHALAMSLQDAKSAGSVGEQQNGYLGIIKGSAEVQQLVTSVNRKRQAHYKKIAIKNNISTDDVAKLAAEKAIRATESGHYIQLPSGRWQKK